MNLPKKLAYSFGSLATAISYQAFATYIIFFYVDMVKLPPHLAAIAMIIYGIWNAVNDPLAGYISDHTRTKWGRRIPYIAFGAIPFGLVYFLLWIPPFTSFSEAGFLFLYFIFFICLFDTFYTMTVLNWSSLYPEMFSGLRERSEVNAFRQTFGMIGLLLGIAMPPMLYSSLGWGTMGLIFGLLIAVSLLITLLGSREHKEFSREKQLRLWPSFKTVFTNRSFLTFIFSNLFVQYSFTLILATTPFFSKYVLGLKPIQTTAVFAMAFLTALPMLYLWEKAVNHHGAKKSFMAAIFILALAIFPLFLVNSFGAALLVSAFIGIGLAGFILIVDIIISDVIDEDEIKTKTRREGIYFGANAFINRFAIALEAGSMGLVFVFSGYNPYVFSQTREFLRGLRILMAGFPILALVLAFVIIWFYPLSGKDKFKELKQQISRLHQKKGVSD